MGRVALDPNEILLSQLRVMSCTSDVFLVFFFFVPLSLKRTSKCGRSFVVMSHRAMCRQWAVQPSLSSGNDELSSTELPSICHRDLEASLIFSGSSWCCHGCDTQQHFPGRLNIAQQKKDGTEVYTFSSSFSPPHWVSNYSACLAGKLLTFPIQRLPFSDWWTGCCISDSFINLLYLQRSFLTYETIKCVCVLING